MDFAKCWRRRLRLPIERALLIALVAASDSGAQPARSPDAQSELAPLEAFLADVQSLTADFRQELWTAEQELLQTDSGTLALERPNRFRWVYREPTELTIVADGSELKIYDVELAQVTVAPFDDSIGASPAMLLSGDRNVRDTFDVAQSYRLEGLEWVKLTPKTGGTDFTSVRIGFEGTAPRRLELVDGLNQVTRIELTNLAINPKLDAAVFELEVPAGVDVIGDEG
jgi:outer membrane lipoprotein carrier protein